MEGGWQQHQQQLYADESGSHAIMVSQGIRRSWMSKDKPYVCRYPGCSKSYFYVHDLRRHEKLKQHGNKVDDNGEVPGHLHETSPLDVPELQEQTLPHMANTD
ncbi:hypothetical protein LSAT2_021699, partial [Lamellibrachia satsuma]